jgi:hypothetical protein
LGRARTWGTIPAARWANSPRRVGARGTGGSGSGTLDLPRSTFPPQRLHVVD